MHMSDALITPIVGGTMMATSSGVMGYAIRSIRNDLYEKKLPLMAVMGAFLFAVQMINFAIPGTGSSGHIGGGMLLAIVLGPAAAFITMASVLLIQALFFADGGLLAYGCNLMNLGFFTAFVAYPLIYKPMVKNHLTKNRLFMGSILASVIGLQLGSLGVVLETWISGRTALTFSTFLMFMQPIHLAIGIVEGMVTAVIVHYIYTQKEELIYVTPTQSSALNVGKLIRRLMVATILIGVLISLIASSNPDGLEWAVEKSIGQQEMDASGPITSWLEALQNKTAILPDYNFKKTHSDGPVGTSVSGLTGSFLTLAITLLIGWMIQLRRRKYKSDE